MRSLHRWDKPKPLKKINIMKSKYFFVFIFSVCQSFAVPIQLYKYGTISARAIVGTFLVASSVLDIAKEHKTIKVINKLYKEGHYGSLMNGLYGIIKYHKIDCAMVQDVDRRCRLAILEEEDRESYTAKCTEWRAKELKKMREKLCIEEVLPALKKRHQEIDIAGKRLPNTPVKLAFLAVGLFQLQKAITQR